MRIGLIMSVCASLVAASAACAQDETPCKRLWDNVFAPYFDANGIPNDAMWSGPNVKDGSFYCTGSAGNCVAKFKVMVKQVGQDSKPATSCPKDKDLNVCVLGPGDSIGFSNKKIDYTLTLTDNEHVKISGKYLTPGFALFPFGGDMHPLGDFMCDAIPSEKAS